MEKETSEPTKKEILRQQLELIAEKSKSVEGKNLQKLTNANIVFESKKGELINGYNKELGTMCKR